MFSWRKHLLPALLPLVVWLIGGELLAVTGWIPTYILPPPSSVLLSFWGDRLELLRAAAETFLSAFLGLTLSCAVGGCIAMTLSLSSFLRRIFLPYAIFFQTVPIIAIAPLLVIWFGFGRPTVIASAFIVSVFPMIASFLLGFQSTDPALVDLFRLYAASRKKTLLLLKIPFSLPQIFSGLKISAGLSIIGAIVGEFIAGGGLGSIVDTARTQQRVDKVFAAIIGSSLIGLIFISGINWVAKKCIGHWHASELPRDLT